jgi:hypothetical protein
LKIEIDRKCDAINNVVLVLSNPDHLSINELITSIELEIGGERTEYIGGSDIETIIRTSSELMNHEGTLQSINGKTYVPLVISPLNSDTYLPLYQLQYSTVKLNIRLKNQYEHSFEPYLMGNVFSLDSSLRKSNKEIQDITIRHECFGVSRDDGLPLKIKKGINRFRLYYNHPNVLMYFWGFQKHLVKRITLLFEGKPYFDGTYEDLEYKKISKKYKIEPSVIFFSQEPLNINSKSCINFSFLDKAELVIETTQEVETDFHVVALYKSVNKYMSGTHGHVFTKNDIIC